MADFRDKILEFQESNISELQDILEKETGERPTSVNPLTDVMFRRIAPEENPMEFARKSSYYSDELQPVAKNAVALKHLLHEQVGRPLHNRVKLRHSCLPTRPCSSRASAIALA